MNDLTPEEEESLSKAIGSTEGAPPQPADTTESDKTESDKTESDKTRAEGQMPAEAAAPDEPADLPAASPDSPVASPADSPADAPSPSAAAPTPASSDEAREAPKVSKAQFVQLEEVAQAANIEPKDLERLYDIKVRVEVVLGSTRMPLDAILRLHPGSVVELNKLAGEAVDVLANGRMIARAEVVVIDDNFGIKVLEIVGAKQKMAIPPR